MIGHKNIKAILIAALLGLSTAQSTIDPYAIDPSEFSPDARDAMCSTQQLMCRHLCDIATNTNLCNSNTLKFDCTCAANSSAPGLEYYKNSMPSMICARNFKDYIVANPNNGTAQTDCVSFIRNRCGTLERTDYTPVTVVPSPTSKSTSPNPAATSSSPGSVADSTPAPSSSSSGGLSTGAKAGIGASCAIVGLLLLGAVGYYFYRAGKRAGGGGGGGLKTEEDADAKVADAKVADEKVGTDEGKVFGPELEDTQRLEIGGREIPGELEAGAGADAGDVPVEIGMSEREESEVRRVVGNK